MVNGTLFGMKMTERQRPCMRLRALWEDLRRGGDLPLRSEFTAEKLGELLPNSFLIENREKHVPRFRSSASLVQEVMGMGVAGMPFLSIIKPDARAGLEGAVQRVFSEPAAMDLLLEGGGQGLPRMTARLLLLPLRTKHGVDMALGGFETEGIVCAPPLRFHPLKISQQRILLGAGDRQKAGFAEEATPFEGKPKLKLVYSKDRKIPDDEPEEE